MHYRSGQIGSACDSEQQLSNAKDFSVESHHTDVNHNTNDDVINNTDNPQLMLANDGDKMALSQEQREDTTLDPYWRLVERGKGGMVVEDGPLYHYDEVAGHRVKQLCVPSG